ncbi:MAG: isocitrate lyase/phosphoenolpyruvate mutase family protein [Alphaproteobacteria bacterium]|nr:isocitrate lyase/phosphoenolpyruvate mutase family protein [Alphaproteobacteria bacterium]
MSHADRYAAFEKLHDRSALLRLPNAWDAASARIIVHAGAKAVATTSSGVANVLGYPDGNKLPRDMAVDAVARIAAAVDVPVSADIEEGFGDTPEAVAETVARIADAGAVGINIEDAVKPAEILAAKIAAIRKRLGATPLYINARIDTWLRGHADPLNEALRRAPLYLAAGASGIFVPGVAKPDEIRAVCAAVKAPINVLLWPGLPSPPELSALGVARLSAGGGITAAAFGATLKAATAFLDQDDYAAVRSDALPREVAGKLFSR